MAELENNDNTVKPGLGIHDSLAEWDTCVLPNGEHECWRRYPHTSRGHGCRCGFEWPKLEKDDR
jgi:hypothetical protein